jgi:cell pole-organizing protein PopZ
MSNPQHEPTMEEILASIRKIISEDAPEGGAPAPEAPAPAPVAAAPAPMAPAPPPPAPVHEDVLELTEEVHAPAPMAPEPVEEIVFENVAQAPTAHSDIFSDQTRKAMEDTFNSIPEEPEPEAPVRARAPALAPVDGATVENVFERAVRESFEPVLQKYIADNSSAVIERMKPLIREWMDEHFPALLEGAVRAEVERVVKARGTKR